MSFMCCLSDSLTPSVVITFPLSPLLFSKLPTMSPLNISTVCMYQRVSLALTFGKKFQVIHKQQVIQFESLVAQFIASLSPYQ